MKSWNAETFKKYDPAISPKYKAYALFQYLFITYIFLVFIQGNYLNYSQLWVTISMMTFTMFCTSMLFDGKKGTIFEIVRLGLCLSIGAYAYFQISLTDIAMSVIIYSVINILLSTISKLIVRGGRGAGPETTLPGNSSKLTPLTVPEIF